MKKRVVAILAILFVLQTISFGFAEEKKKAETKYEVTITITYNAVSISEAQRLHNEAIEEHKDACKVTVKTEKGQGLQSGMTYYFQPNASNTITLEDTKSLERR